MKSSRLLRIYAYLDKSTILQAVSLSDWRSRVVIFRQNECSAAVTSVDSAE